MTVLRSIVLFALAALAEIGGGLAGLARRPRTPGPGLRRRWVPGPGRLWVCRHPPTRPHFGRILAACGGVFVAGSLAWAMLVDGFRPDRYDLAGAALCLVGVAVIMYAPRAS
jgi:small multidrug resistance family-3 protein